MFFSLSNTEQASPIKLLWQLVWLLPHFPLPPLPQSNKQVKETELIACHWILKYLKTTFLQPSWHASKRVGGRKGESEGRVSLSLLFCLSPSPPPPPTTMKRCLRRFRRHLCIGDAPATAPFLAFFISPSSLPSESLEQAKDNHKVFRSNLKKPGQREFYNAFKTSEIFSTAHALTRGSCLSLWWECQFSAVPSEKLLLVHYGQCCGSHQVKPRLDYGTE